MKILILHPGRLAKNPSEIKCFSDMWCYYFIDELRRHASVKIKQISSPESGEISDWFRDLGVSGYDAVIALGLRYFSTIPKEIGKNLRKRVYPGFLCQVHDGSRLDNDPVDITFTLKDESEKYPFNSEANRWVRHHSYNEYIGWAADSDLNVPMQDDRVLRILVDHTNYGPNPVDLTKEILKDIQRFIISQEWKTRWDDIVVRRFDSGRVVDVDFDRIDEIERYDRTAIPFTDICQEHGKTHIFCVTHPESVGQSVLETAMAGALPLCPQGFIPRDRLDTVRAIEYNGKIDWKQVLDSIDPVASRTKALENDWITIAKRVRDIISIRKHIRGQGGNNG